MALDFYLGPAKAPDVEISPIDGRIDLVWSDGKQRVVIGVANEKELRLLVRRAFEAVGHEREREAQEAGA